MWASIAWSAWAVLSAPSRDLFTSNLAGPATNWLGLPALDSSASVASSRCLSIADLLCSVVRSIPFICEMFLSSLSEVMSPIGNDSDASFALLTSSLSSPFGSVLGTSRAPLLAALLAPLPPMRHPLGHVVAVLDDLAAPEVEAYAAAIEQHAGGLKPAHGLAHAVHPHREGVGALLDAHR